MWRLAGDSGWARRLDIGTDRFGQDIGGVSHLS